MLLSLFLSPVQSGVAGWGVGAEARSVSIQRVRAPGLFVEKPAGGPEWKLRLVAALILPRVR